MPDAQPAGDLGFQQEPGAADRIVGMAVEDLLRATSRCSSASARRHHPPPERGAARSGTARRRGRWRCRRRRSSSGRRHHHRLALPPSRSCSARCGQASPRSRARRRPARLRASGLARRHGRQALLDITAVRLQMNRGQGIEHRPLGTGQVADGLPGDRRGCVALSSVHAWNAATSWPWSMMPVCSASKSEEEMAIGGGHGEAPRHGIVPSTTGDSTAPEPGHAGSVASGLFSHGHTGCANLPNGLR